jgi:hypothetical protein
MPYRGVKGGAGVYQTIINNMSATVAKISRSNVGRYQGRGRVRKSILGDSEGGKGTYASKQPKVSGRKLAAIVEPRESSKFNVLSIHSVKYRSFLIRQKAENRD